MEELQFFEKLEEEFPTKEFPDTSAPSIVKNEKVGSKTYKEGRFYGHAWLKREWRVIQFALFKMAMHSLPEQQRQVIRSIFIDGLGESEIANKLKLNETKIRQIKARALKTLKSSAFVKMAISPKMLEQKDAL